MSKKQTTRRTARGRSPVVDITKRAIPWPVRLRLWVEAGGRCQFDSCNDYLLEHRVTRRSGNFGEAAHIVAFKPEGPRGRDGARPVDIHNASNLMLLGADCHKLIDDHPDDYSRKTLEVYKSTHEARIKHLTSLGIVDRTAVLVVKVPITGQTVSVPFDHIVEATSPRYPARRELATVDLTTIADDGGAFLTTVCDTIKRDVEHFFGPNGEGRQVGHVSIFALGPMAPLIFLGQQLTNKVATDLFQRHRDTEKWTWKRGGRTARYVVRRLRRGRNGGKVALLASLSGTIRIRDLPEDIRRSATIYTITLADQTPRPTFLRKRQDLEGFRTAYQKALGLISQKHGLVQAIEFFPAVPAPVAVLCGRELLPKVHPRLRVWDYDKKKGGFTFQLEVN